MTSIGREFSIHFSNAGASAMKVDKITFRVGDFGPIESLSSIFNDIPVDKQSEVRINGMYLQPGSRRRLYNSIIDSKSQSNLIRAWKIVENTTVIVEFRDLHGEAYSHIQSLKGEYDTFSDALRGRKLKDFQEL